MLLSHRSISPNAVHPTGSGTTALHLAMSLPRVDAVILLLEQDGIDDTLRDAHGQTCIEVAKGKDVVRAVKGAQRRSFLKIPLNRWAESRVLFNASYRSLLRSYIGSPPSERPPDALIAMLSLPRAKILDLLYLDDVTGGTLLHEAAKRKDLRMVELAVRAGADVFVRDRKGRSVTDGLGKDDRVRVFLRQCAYMFHAYANTAHPETPSQQSGYHAS